MDRLCDIKRILIDNIEYQVNNLYQADYKELGEAIDMVKDIEEAIYYCTIINSMNNQDNNSNDILYYSTPMHHEGVGVEEASIHHLDAIHNSKEGKSPIYRKNYIEAKEMHKNKDESMKELETYMQELTNDIIEMIENATPEEKQVLRQKITALASKIA